MTTRVLQVGEGPRRVVTVLYHLTEVLDSRVKEALGPSPIVLNVTLPPGGGYRQVQPGGGVAPVAELVAWMRKRVAGDFTVGPVVLIGFSEGCQAVRAQLAAGFSPSAIVLIDGTHGSWPTRTAFELEHYRAYFQRAARGDVDALFIATHSALRYVESLKPTPQSPKAAPYASTWRVLSEVTGWPLDGRDEPDITREGRAVVYSYNKSTDHAAQAQRVLPLVLRDELRPHLSALAPAVSDEVPPTVDDPTPAEVFYPAEKTVVKLRDILVAMAVGWRDALGTVPSADAVRLLAAHSALETGHWKSMWNNNLGNIKSRRGDERGHTFFACNEILANAQARAYVAQAKPRTDGKPGLNAAITRDRGDGTSIVWFYPSHEGCRFRAYPTLREGVADYIALLVNHKRFKTCWPFVEAGDPVGFSRALKAARYYTADESVYTNSVRSVLASFAKVEFSVEAALAEVDAASDDGTGMSRQEREAAMGLVYATLERSVWDEVTCGFTRDCDALAGAADDDDAQA